MALQLERFVTVTGYVDVAAVALVVLFLSSEATFAVSELDRRLVCDDTLDGCVLVLLAVVLLLSTDGNRERTGNMACLTVLLHLFLCCHYAL